MISKVKALTNAPILKSVTVSDDKILGVTATDEILIIGYLTDPVPVEKPARKPYSRKPKNGLGTHPLSATREDTSTETSAAL